MAKKDLSEKIEIPQGITVSKEGSSLLFKGPKGTVSRDFNNPGVTVTINGNEITLESVAASKVEKAVLHAYRAHINNAIKGLEEPFVYVLKVCSGHFPMTVTVSNGEFVIKNFLGEKVPRKVKIKQGANVKVDGSNVLVESPDKELAGQVAADIEQATRRPGFDKRIFQDGLYIIEKAGKKI